MKKYNTDSRYLSKKTLAKAGFKTHFFKICGTILTILFATSIVMAATGYDLELRKNLIVYVLLFIPSALMMYSGIKAGKICNLANSYSNIFECDEDGVVTIDELNKQTGKPKHIIISELDMLLSNNYLCSCTLERKGRVRVILSNGDIEAEDGFVNVVCDVCKGTTRIRAGRSGVCQYCGSSLNNS